MPLGKLRGQAAIVTGASSGIGKAIALQLGREGASVVVNYHGEEKEAKAVQDKIIQAGGRAITVHADVSREEDVQRMFAEGEKAFGPPDILISNAGIESNSPFTEMSLGAWQKVIDINLTGCFLCAREAARAFTRKGITPERSVAAGKIIFTSSVHDRIPWAGHVNYAASKGGVMLMMQSIAQELGPQKIRVNSISPGAIRTPINHKAWDTPEAMDKLLELIPYGRIGEPEDVGKVAAWLASDESDYITGATIYVDGGMTLYPAFAHGG